MRAVVFTLALLLAGLQRSIVSSMDFDTSCAAVEKDDRAVHGRERKFSAATSTADKQNLVTVVLMNWRRPSNVRRLLGVYKTYPEVGEVMIINNNKKHRFEYRPYQKLVLIDYSNLFEMYGLTARFKGCLLAANSWVLIVDDDLMVTRSGLQRLLKAKAAMPDRVYSFYGNGRRYEDSNPGYVFERGVKDAAIVAGRTMLVDQRMCRLYFDFTDMMDDVVFMERTPWNGEDILMSLVVRAKTGNKPYVIPRDESRLDFKELATGRIGVSKSNDHLRYRNLFTRIALHRLSCLFPDTIPKFKRTREDSWSPGPSDKNSLDAKPDRRPEQNWDSSLARFAIVTGTSPNRGQMFAASAPTMNRYARTVGADFFSFAFAAPQELKDSVSSKKGKFSREPIEPYLNKVLVLGRLLHAGYERVLWLDDSAIVLPACPNLFQIAARADVAGFDESYWTALSSYKRDRDFLSRMRGIKLESDAPYINTGILLVGQALRDDFSLPKVIENLDLFTSAYPTQAYLAFLLYSHKPALTVRLLPEAFNHMMLDNYKEASKKNMKRSFKPSELAEICNASIVHITGHYMYRKSLAPQVAANCYLAYAQRLQEQQQQQLLQEEQEQEGEQEGEEQEREQEKQEQEQEPDQKQEKEEQEKEEKRSRKRMRS